MNDKKEDDAIMSLLDSVYGVGSSKSVLTTIEEQRAYEQQMEEATKDRFERDNRSRALSWQEAKNHVIH